MDTATDDNAEIRNLDARLFKKSTCWHTSTLKIKTSQYGGYLMKKQTKTAQRKQKIPIVFRFCCVYKSV